MADNKRIIGAALATSAALLFASAPARSDLLYNDHEAKEPPSIQCFGSNSCKYQGACRSVYNGCNGQNECKGQGSIMVRNNNDCTNAGGETSQ